MARLSCLLVASCAVVRGFTSHTRPAALRYSVVRSAEDNVESMSSEDPLVQRVAAEVAEATGGAGLDALLNPAKLINLERDLVMLRKRVETEGETEELTAEISKKEGMAYVEKRAVMRDWLKTLFRGQAYGTMALSLALVYDVIPGQDLDLSIRVLGFWSWWLFTVPSLRSIKPLPAPEKKALDAAFIATLVVSLAAPFATKDPAAIWWIDAGTVALCYAYGYLTPESSDTEEDTEFDASASGGAGAFGQSLWRASKFAFKALDVGSGTERGARSTEKTNLERALDSAIVSKAVATDDESPAAAEEREASKK